MNWRAVMVVLASLGLLSTVAPQGAKAQERSRGAPGGTRFAPGGGARGRFGGPGFGGPGFGGPGPGGRGFGPGFGGLPYGGGGYGRGPYGRGGYPTPYGPTPYDRYPDAPPRAEPPPAYAPFGGYGRARPFANGNWREQQDEVRQAVRDGRHIPLGRAIDAVRERMPGRELDAGLEPGPGGRTVYRLRWAASNGRRIDYLVDAATGAIVAEQGGR